MQTNRQKTIGVTLLSLCIVAILAAGCASQPPTASMNVSQYSGVLDIQVTNGGTTSLDYITIVDFFDASGNKVDQVTTRLPTVGPHGAVGVTLLIPANSTRYDPPALYAVVNGYPNRVDYKKV